MSGYTKLHSSIATSSILAMPVSARWLWCYLLSQADAQGIVQGAIPGLAIATNITMAECEAAVDAFSAPDPYSRTKDADGRRLIPVDGGWQIVSYQKWRFKLSAEERRDTSGRTRPRAASALARPPKPRTHGWQSGCAPRVDRTWTSEDIRGHCVRERGHRGQKQRQKQ